METKKFKDLALKIVLLFGIGLLTAYFFFRIQFINLNPYFAVFAIILFIAELHTIFHLYGMFYSIWPRKYITYPNPYKNRNLRINIFICVCGEPVEIVRKTIEAAKIAASYYQKVMNPKYFPRVIVLNDGYVAQKENWRDIYKECQEQGVYHIKRRIRGGFKAGNINNALKMTVTDKENDTIDIIFDSDFAAKKEFLTEITKPFINKNIDFVQSPQRYQNEETWVAKASAAHQIFFFDHICPAKGHDNSLFLCGTNFAIRRKALNDVGGIDTKFITEDYATSLNLHLQGKKGVFLHKVLALGVAPSSLKAYFSQQQRWSKGNFDVTSAYLKDLLFGNLTLKQKLHYLLSATYYLIGLRDFILMLAPVPYLFFGISLIKANTIEFMAMVYGPLLVYNFILYTLLFRHPIKSLVLDIVSFPVFTAAFLSSMLKKNLAFIVTIKNYQKENPFSVYRMQLAVIFILSVGIIYSLVFNVNRGYGAFINYFWATFDVTFLTLGFLLITRENYDIRSLKRVIQLLAFPTRRLNVSVVSRSFNNFVILRTVFPLSLLAVMFFFGVNDSTLKIMAAMQELRISSPIETTDTKVVEEELLVPERGAYYGYYFPELNSHPEEPQISLVSGEKPSLLMYYQDWSGTGGSFNKDFVDSLSRQNITPVITWEPWDSTKGLTSFEQPEYSPKLISEGKYDAYIRNWAKEAAEYGKPFFLRFAHEMNGNWYAWGHVGENSAEDFKQMWIHVYNIFEEEGATNALWVWAPNNTDEYGETSNVLDFYPGSEYVDWVGFSGFNWGTTNYFNRWTRFNFLADDIYTILSELNKPIMVAETSSVSYGGDKELWFRQTLVEDIPSMPNIKAVVFFNQNFKRANFSLASGMDINSVFKEILIDNEYYLKDPIIVYR